MSITTLLDDYLDMVDVGRLAAAEDPTWSPDPPPQRDDPLWTKYPRMCAALCGLWDGWREHQH